MEYIEELIPEDEEEDIRDMSIQRFFSDMDMLGNQINKKGVKKPNFFYGDVSITNYLLWLIYAELSGNKVKRKRKARVKQEPVEEPEEEEEDNVNDDLGISGRRALDA